MTNVAARELRNDTRSVIERVEHGESITITVGGRPVATLEPLHVRPEFTPRAAFLQAVLGRQADAALTGELRDLGPDTTDDLALP